MARIIRKLPDVPRLTHTVKDNHYTSDKYMNPINENPLMLTNRAEHARRRKRALEEAQRNKEQIFSLYRQGVPRKEIASMIGISVNSVVAVIGRGFREGDLTEYVVSDDERQIIELYKKRMSYKQIATVMKVTEGSISSTLHRLRVEGLL